MTRTGPNAGSNDGVSETFRPLATGFEEHWKTIVVVAGVALGALLVVALVLQSQSHRREEAAQSVGDALANVAIPVLAPSDEAPDAADAKPDGKPAGKDAAKLDPKLDSKKPAKSRFQAKDDFPTEQAKQEAIIKQAQETIADYPSQPSARVAELTLGDANYKLGKFAEAAQAYNKFLADAPETEYTRAYGEIGLAYAMVGLGKKDEALTAVKALVEHPPGGFGRDLGLVAQGHIAEDLGQTDLAKQVYRALRSEAPDSAAGREATERLTFLGEPPVPQKPQVMGTPGASAPAVGAASPTPAN